MKTTGYKVRDYTVAWIAALEIERAAATAQLDESHEEPHDFEQRRRDNNSYDWGRIGKHNIVIASLPSGQMGSTPAAFTAANLLSSLPCISFGLLVGIGGGIPTIPHKDIRLGDVVISKPTRTTGGIVQYDKIATVAGGKKQLRSVLRSPPELLLHALSAMKANHELEVPRTVEILAKMQAKYPRMVERGYEHQGSDNDRLFSSSYEHAGGFSCDRCDPSSIQHRDHRPTTDPEIHCGLIASGNTLFKDPFARQELEALVGQEEECLCVEMWAAGVVNNLPCIVIRGICDYADSHRNDRWQRYASATAAACTKELLGYVRAQKLEEVKPASETMESIQKVQGGVKNVEPEVNNLKTFLDADQLKKIPETLHPVKGASSDFSTEDEGSRCLKGTCVESQSEVQHWTVDSKVYTVLWLDEEAGTGKSTVSRSAGDALVESGCLGASVFFARGEEDHGSLKNLSMALASHLATSIPRLAKHAKEAPEDGISTVEIPPNLQFGELIAKPREKDSKKYLKPQHQQLVVLVINALDKYEASCGTGLENDVERLIQTSLDERRVGLKVFVTSRPELPLRLAFASKRGA